MCQIWVFKGKNNVLFAIFVTELLPFNNPQELKNQNHEKLF